MERHVILTRTICMRIPTSKFALTLLVTVVILGATIQLTWFFERCGLNVQDQVRSVQSMKDYVGWNWFFIKLVAMVVVVSPVVEELIFRFPTRLVKHTIFAVVISILFVILEYPHLLKMLPSPWRALRDFCSLKGFCSVFPCILFESHPESNSNSICKSPFRSLAQFKPLHLP